MQQELEQIVAVGAALAAIPVGVSLGAFIASVISYKDTMMYYSRTDFARQQKLGKPEFLKLLGEDLRNLANVRRMFSGEFDDSYSWRYWSAYLESQKEQENNKYLGYRKIKEST